MKCFFLTNQSKLSLKVMAAVFTFVSVAQHTFAQDSNSAISLKENRLLNVVDSAGKPIPASEIPEDLRARLAKLEYKGTGDFGLVLGRVILPEREKNLEYSATLMVSWGFAGAFQPDLRTETDQSVISCWLTKSYGKLGGCKMDIAKAGYKGVTIPLPGIDFEGKIIWLGDIAVEAYSRQDPVWHVVRGAVLTPDGRPVEGLVGLRVNGTRGEVAQFTNGLFKFADVTPGEYIVECLVKDHSVADWWVGVNSDKSENLTAYPLRKYRVRVDDPDDSRDQWLTAGLRTGHSCIKFRDGQTISFIQSGDAFNLDCAQTIRMRVGGTVYPSGSYRWKGVLKQGDTVELLEKETDTVLHKITCLEVAEP